MCDLYLGAEESIKLGGLGGALSVVSHGTQRLRAVTQGRCLFFYFSYFEMHVTCDFLLLFEIIWFMYIFYFYLEGEISLFGGTVEGMISSCSFWWSPFIHIIPKLWIYFDVNRKHKTNNKVEKKRKKIVNFLSESSEGQNLPPTWWRRNGQFLWTLCNASPEYKKMQLWKCHITSDVIISSHPLVRWIYCL